MAHRQVTEQALADDGISVAMKSARCMRPQRSEMPAKLPSQLDVNLAVRVTSMNQLDNARP